MVKITSFQTESELSEQRGIEQLLRGLYLALRHRRSHEKRSDTAENAEVVIAFVSFFVRLIDNSKSPFDSEQIIQKVFDKHFVPSEQYASALAVRISPGKRYDVLSHLFHRRSEGKIQHVSIVTKAILAMVGDDLKTAYWEMVSGALEEASTNTEFRTAVYLLSTEWDKLSEVARLRIENRLLSSISEGEYDSTQKLCTKGSLGTWASGLTQHFSMKVPLREALIDRLNSGSQPAIDYVLNFLTAEVFNKNIEPEWDLTYALEKLLDSDDPRVHSQLWFVGTDQCASQWNEELKGVMEKYKVRNMPDDDIPF